MKLPARVTAKLFDALLGAVAVATALAVFAAARHWFVPSLIIGSIFVAVLVRLLLFAEQRKALRRPAAGARR
jgi:hypothetical protein